MIIFAKVDDDKEDSSHLIKQHQEYFDNSVYDPSHPLYCADYAGKPGVLKPEFTKRIREVVVLNMKCYATTLEGDEDSKELERCKGKGINKCNLKRLRAKHYKETLFGRKLSRLRMNLIRSKSHKLLQISLNKVSLHALSLRNFTFGPGNVLSRPFGYHLVSKLRLNEGIKQTEFSNFYIIQYLVVGALSKCSRITVS